LELRPYIGGSTWEIAGSDWRLTPLLWFRLVTPDFRDEVLWGPVYQDLKLHLKQSPFCDHYDSLCKSAQNLEEEYSQAVERLLEVEPQFTTAWIKGHRGLEWYTEPSWVPGIERNLNSVGPLPLGAVFVDRSVRLLGSNEIPDLGTRLHQMEARLQELWNDLDPDVIEPLIANGWCKRCGNPSSDIVDRY